MNTTMNAPSIAIRILLVGFSHILHCLIYFSEKGFSLEGGIETEEIPESRFTHTIKLDSLLPTRNCTPFIRGRDQKKSSTIEVAYKYGPCSYLKNEDKYIAPKHSQIIVDDKHRVTSIRKRLLTNTKTYLENDIGLTNYLVKLGLGTPKQDLPFILDNARALTWTKCRTKPKAGKHNFIPSMSTSFNASAYNISDEHYDGYFNEERLTLTSQDILDKFLFICNGGNPHRLGSPAGIFGLAHDELISFIKQSKDRYEQIFSYCLPSKSSYTGYLSFGNKYKASTQFTPLVNTSSIFYAVEIVGINVGGFDINVKDVIRSMSHIIVDLGTEITRLPYILYDIVRKQFQKMMNIYPRSSEYHLFDTCYDLSSYESVTIPIIKFRFGNGFELNINPSGILNIVSKTQVCLAFARGRRNESIAIFGTMQQKKLELVYDVGRGRMGFNHGGCD